MNALQLQGTPAIVHNRFSSGGFQMEAFDRFPLYGLCFLSEGKVSASRSLGFSPVVVRIGHVPRPSDAGVRTARRRCLQRVEQREGKSQTAIQSTNIDVSGTCPLHRIRKAHVTAETDLEKPHNYQ